MDVKLIVLGGKNAGKEVPVTQPKFFIGRSEDCQLRPQSDLVSRHHCAILVEEGYVSVRDFGSKNGTQVNGEVVRTQRELHNGDRLQVGPLEFEVRLTVEVGGKKKPKVQSIQEAASRAAETGARDEDVDVSDWLDDGQQAAPLFDDETQRLGAEPAAPFGQADEQPPAPTTKSPHKKEKETAPKLVGRFQGGAKPTTDTSRSAAAEMLKHFFDKK